MNRSFSLHAICLTGAIAAAVFLFYISPFDASNFEHAPDSVEYAFGAFRLVNHHSFDIIINAKSYPSRYTPWFSFFFIAPAYIIFGNEPGNAIVPVFIFAVIGVIAAFFIGKRISGLWGAILASCMLLGVPMYRDTARQVLTDVPCAALMALMLLLYLHMRSAEKVKVHCYSLAGILVAASIALRPTSAGVILPFLILCLRSKQERLFHITILFMPAILLTTATLWYNGVTFGSPWRNGYNFWCPVPYDYLNLTFSMNYIANNFLAALSSGLPVFILLIGGCIGIIWRQTSLPGASFRLIGTPAMDVLWFIVLSCFPIILFYLFYFYSESRFFLPVVMLCAIEAGGLLGIFIQQFRETYALIAQGILLVITVCYTMRVPDVPPLRRISAENILKNTPPDSVIISVIDGAYLEFIAGQEGSRQFLPLNRSVEYASKLIGRRRIDNPSPPPVAWWDHRAEGLKKQGAKDLFAETVEENPVQIVKILKEKKDLFLSYGGMNHNDLAVANNLASALMFIHVADDLYRIKFRN